MGAGWVQGGGRGWSIPVKDDHINAPLGTHLISRMITPPLVPTLFLVRVVQLMILIYGLNPPPGWCRPCSFSRAWGPRRLRYLFLSLSPTLSLFIPKPCTISFQP